MKEFLMPSLGADMEGGTLVEWLKAPGDEIDRGDILAVVETVKGAIEIECFDKGTVTEILIEPGTAVVVGEVLARIDDGKTAGEMPRAPAPRDGRQAQSATASGVQRALAAQPVRPPESSAVTERIPASPAARRRAAEIGIELSSLTPGPDGVIGMAEVEAAANTFEKAGTPSRPGYGQGLDRDAMRRAIGVAMSRSKREIPHYYVSSTFDVTDFVRWLEALNREREVAERVLYAAPLLKAVARAMNAAPQLNGTSIEGLYHPSSAVHVGVATALRGGGLVAPALHDAGGLSLDEAMARLRDIVSRVRSGRIRSSEMTDATVTLSILGEDTADTVQPIIYPPQVAIIGCGAIRERPWIVGREIVPRRVMTVTVAGDHRVSDGRVAARFLKRLEAILNDPAQLHGTDMP